MVIVTILRDDQRVGVPITDRNWSLYRPRGLVRAVIMNEPFEVTLGGQFGSTRVLCGQAGDVLVSYDDDAVTQVYDYATFSLMFDQVSV